MKNTNKNLTSKLALAAFLALGTLAVTSCNKDSNQAGQEIPTGKSQIIVRIAGISDGESVAKGPKAGLRTASTNNTATIVEANGFDALVATDNNITTDASPLAKGLRAATGARAAAGIAAGTTYNLYLYKNNGGTYTFEKVIQFIAGQETAVELTNGAYKWVALSYNNTATLPDGTTNNIDLPENTDVLYKASTEDIIIGGEEVPVNITFDRVFSRIAVEINTLGMFGPMTKNPTITVSGDKLIKSGKLDLATGTLVPSATGSDLALTETSFGDVSPINGTSFQKVAYFYTAAQTEQAIAVTVKDLEIKLDNGTARSFGSTTLNQTLKVAPEAGKNHRLLVGLAESALTYEGVQWSRSNLTYFGGDVTPYRFKSSNVYTPTADPNGYFTFRGHLPRKLASGNESLQKDPCALVYPAQLWKTPTENDLAKIQNQSGLLGNLLGSVGEILLGTSATPGAKLDADQQYLEFTPSKGNNSAYDEASNKLRFNFDGLQPNISLVEGLVKLDLGSSKGHQVAFWTQDKAIDVLGLAGVGAFNYFGFAGKSGILGLGPRVPKGSIGASLLTIDLLGLNVVSSALMPVRCVRNSNWATISAQPDYNPNPVY
ncbi:hypothetical protein ACFX5U_20160 [Sphingobacterium sp. SG20118]|uniref:hypothetical protein n=1 Tax=Sphingobacterium sp. SG20118 TaxID=3367156 RepID=UPI0037DFBEB5